jgi:hypothetical protein
VPGLSLITAAIVQRNMVYLVQRLCAQRAMVLDDFLAHVAPLEWEHIGRRLGLDRDRPLRAVPALCEIRARSRPGGLA